MFIKLALTVGIALLLASGCDKAQVIQSSSSALDNSPDKPSVAIADLPQNAKVDPPQNTKTEINWKTYRNDTYEFSLRYPSNLMYTVSTDEKEVRFSKLNSADSIWSPDGIPTLVLEVKDNPYSLSLEQYYQRTAKVDGYNPFVLATSTQKVMLNTGESATIFTELPSNIPQDWAVIEKRLVLLEVRNPGIIDNVTFLQIIHSINF